jgi:hypothetical protein
VKFGSVDTAPFEEETEWGYLIEYETGPIVITLESQKDAIQMVARAPKERKLVSRVVPAWTIR